MGDIPLPHQSRFTVGEDEVRERLTLAEQAASERLLCRMDQTGRGVSEDDVRQVVSESLSFEFARAGGWTVPSATVHAVTRTVIASLPDAGAR